MAIEGVVGRVAAGLVERTATAVTRNKALWPEWAVEKVVFRTGAGTCIMCEKPTGAARKEARAKGGRTSNRVVLMQSGLGLYCRSLCGWPSFGWCGAKSIDGVPTPCTEDKISPQDTCGDCFWVCFNCYDPVKKDYAAEQKKKKRNAAPSEPATVQPTEAPQPKRPRKYKKDDFDDYGPQSKQRSDKDLQQNLTEFAQATSSSTDCANARVKHMAESQRFRDFFDIRDKHLDSLVESWGQNCDDKPQQRAILSIAVGEEPEDGWSYNRLANKFKCPLKDIQKARAHARKWGPGRRAPIIKRRRQRMKIPTVNFLSPFTVDPDVKAGKALLYASNTTAAAVFQGWDEGWHRKGTRSSHWCRGCTAATCGFRM